MAASDTNIDAILSNSASTVDKILTYLRPSFSSQWTSLLARIDAQEHQHNNLEARLNAQEQNQQTLETRLNVMKQQLNDIEARQEQQHKASTARHDAHDLQHTAILETLDELKHAITTQFDDHNHSITESFEKHKQAMNSLLDAQTQQQRAIEAQQHQFMLDTDKKFEAVKYDSDERFKTQEQDTCKRFEAERHDIIQQLAIHKHDTNQLFETEKRQQKDTHDRLIKLELTACTAFNNREQQFMASTATQDEQPVTSPVNFTQLDKRHTATMQALQLQLMHATKDAAQPNQQLQQQLNSILLQNQTDAQMSVLHEQKFDLHTSIITFCLNNVASSKVEQLELLVKSHITATSNYNEYKEIVDALASDSISGEEFDQLETIVSLMAQKQGVADQQLLESTEQQRTVIADMCSKLQKLETQSQRLQTFIDDASRVSDPALRHTLDSQQVIVKTMQREVDGYRQEISARLTSEWQQMRETLASVAIRVLTGLAKEVSQITSVQIKKEINLFWSPQSKADIMSVFSTGQLLVGCISKRCLFIYSADGYLLVPIAMDYNGLMRDATWTSRGNIVCSVETIGILTMTRTGTVIAKKELKTAMYFSVSDDNSVYVACGEDGVYQSTDDGMTWMCAFKPSYLDLFLSTLSYQLWHAIKVSSDSEANVFYATSVLEGANDANLEIREYTVNKASNVSRCTFRIDCRASRKLAFDSRSDILFLNENTQTLSLFSVRERTVRTLDLSDYLEQDKRICTIAIDSRLTELYVSFTDGKVKVFKFQYGPSY